jgi:hypothetical protein
MDQNPVEVLRAAGLLSEPLTPELEQFYATLTKKETEVLLSVTSRIDALLSDVSAHSMDWTTPGASQEGFEAAMSCACGQWTGAGNTEA